MSTADTYVRARIDAGTKERATAALDAMGLSVSDAIRLLMLRVRGEGTEQEQSPGTHRDRGRESRALRYRR